MKTKVLTPQQLKKIQRKDIRQINNILFGEHYPMLTVSNKNVFYYDVQTQGNTYFSEPLTVTYKD
jgi:hypothetical protein